MSSNGASPKRLLAISSGGGHWLQLRRVVPALQGVDAVYASVGNRDELKRNGERYYQIPDASRWSSKWSLILMAVRVCALVVYLRPSIIVSTGAAPGFVALRFGKLLGARCVWIDSIANVAQVSMSGKRVQPYADLSLTQWPKLGGVDGFEHAGSVLPISSQ